MPVFLHVSGALVSTLEHSKTGFSPSRVGSITLSFRRALNLRRHSTVSCLCIMDATVERCCRTETTRQQYYTMPLDDIFSRCLVKFFEETLTQTQGCLRACSAVILLAGLMVNIWLIRFLASGVTVSHSGDGN